MKIFHKGKLINTYVKGKLVKGKTSKSRLIAQYKFDKSIYDNLIPEFNTEFTNYKIVDEYLDTEDIATTSAETMMLMNYDTEPDEYGVLTTEETVENVSTFNAENIVTRSIYSSELPTLMRFGEHTASNRTQSLLSVQYLNINDVGGLYIMFKNCSNLNYVDTSNWVTSKVVSMEAMCYNCQSLTQLDVSDFDTSNVTDMRSMFYGCQSLTSLNVSNFNTSKVTNMAGMFEYCQSLKSLDVSNFDTSNVTDMRAFMGHLQSAKIINLNNLHATDTKTIIDGDDRFLLNTVAEKMYLNDLDTLNTVLRFLPDRTGKEAGELVTSIRSQISQETIDALTAKNWEIFEENIYFVLGKSKIGNGRLKPINESFVLDESKLDIDRIQ